MPEDALPKSQWPPKVIITGIPHADQRYPTCGDWFIENHDKHGGFRKEHDVLCIRVSKEMPSTSQAIVAIHELIEYVLCRHAGISVEQVDAFDMKYEKERMPDDNSEPGDSVDAPYQRQHSIATGIERILCAEMGITWKEHEDSINSLS